MLLPAFGAFGVSPLKGVGGFHRSVAHDMGCINDERNRYSIKTVIDDTSYFSMLRLRLMCYQIGGHGL